MVCYTRGTEKPQESKFPHETPFPLLPTHNFLQEHETSWQPSLKVNTNAISL